jgi:hypothetical protein
VAAELTRYCQQQQQQQRKYWILKFRPIRKGRELDYLNFGRIWGIIWSFNIAEVQSPPLPSPATRSPVSSVYSTAAASSLTVPDSPYSTTSSCEPYYTAEGSPAPPSPQINGSSASGTTSNISSISDYPNSERTTSPHRSSTDLSSDEADAVALYGRKFDDTVFFDSSRFKPSKSPGFEIWISNITCINIKRVIKKEFSQTSKFSQEMPLE